MLMSPMTVISVVGDLVWTESIIVWRSSMNWSLFLRGRWYMLMIVCVGLSSCLFACIWMMMCLESWMGFGFGRVLCGDLCCSRLIRRVYGCVCIVGLGSLFG